MKKPKAQDVWNKKQGPTEMLAEIERLKATGKLPSLEQVLAAVAEVRQEYAAKILEARKQGHDPGHPSRRSAR